MEKIRGLKCVFHPRTRIIHSSILTANGRTYNRYVCGYKKGCGWYQDVEVTWQEGRRWD